MTATIKPGDVVVLEGEYDALRSGARAVVDSMYFGVDDEVLVCFRASAYRSDGPDLKLSIVEAIELRMTNGDTPIPAPFVSCSGGPGPCIKIADLEYIGETEQAFWRWKDRPRAGGGENFTATVNLWQWTHNDHERIS